MVWSLAVSYTHLRAHETVLDLVCRLLLEKKKKENKKKKKKRANKKKNKRTLKMIDQINKKNYGTKTLSAHKQTRLS